MVYVNNKSDDLNMRDLVTLSVQLTSKGSDTDPIPTHTCVDTGPLPSIEHSFYVNVSFF